jgi:hypothetical protein
MVEREGPTGLLVATTRNRLRPGNETHLLSLPVDESPEQTAEALPQAASRPTARTTGVAHLAAGQEG